MQLTFFPDWGSNRVHWTQSPTLYHVAKKAGLYHKAVQVWYIPIPDDILPLQSEIHPRQTGDQEVADSTFPKVGNLLSWILIMKYFLRSFSPFR